MADGDNNVLRFSELSLYDEKIKGYIDDKTEGLSTYNDIYAEDSLNLGRLENSPKGEYNSVTLGYNCVAADKADHAEGYETTASGGYGSHAEGQGTSANGVNSHAEGYETTASGYYTHAEGNSTYALGSASHAEGYNSVANGYYAHAEGSSTTAIGSSHSEGISTTALGSDYSSCHAEGYSTYATTDRVQDSIHAEGVSTTASILGAHAEGISTYASNSGHSEGIATTANNSSHSEGGWTFATGSNSHAEGSMTSATGGYAHAEGERTLASGYYSHSEGRYTTSDGYYCHAEGDTTRALTYHAHVEGYCTTAVGYSNGSAHAEGNHTYSYTSWGSSHAEGTSTSALGNGAHAEGYATYAPTSYTHAEGNRCKAISEGSHVEGYETTSTSYYSHVEGYQTSCNGNYCHVEGYQSSASDGAYAAHGEGSGTYIVSSYSHAEGRLTTAGYAAHAEGYSTYAINEGHSEGDNTEAKGYYSHAEGYCTTAIGSSSHTEGRYNFASGETAHAEGYSTSAYSLGSHTEGAGTIAIGEMQHVEGSYNIENPQYLHIVGNGYKTIYNYNKNNNYTVEMANTATNNYRIRIYKDGTRIYNEMVTAFVLNDLNNGLYVYDSENSGHNACILSYNNPTIETISPSKPYSFEGIDYHLDPYSGINNTTYNPTNGDKFVECILTGNLSSTTSDANDIEIVLRIPLWKVDNGSTILEERSNAHTLDWDGNAWFAGDITDGHGNTLSEMVAAMNQSSGYLLPKATTSTLGGVKVDGTTITVDNDGVISGSSNYTLPTASTSTLGGVKVDGSTITIDNNGVISSSNNSSSIINLDDVSISSLQDGQYLKYNSSTGKWENETGNQIEEIELLGSGTATLLTSESEKTFSITLNKNFNNYNWIIIDFGDTVVGPSGDIPFRSTLFFKNQKTTNIRYRTGAYLGRTNGFLSLKPVSNTQIDITYSNNEKFSQQSNASVSVYGSQKLNLGSSSNNTITNGVNYSTSEQVIGTWIDGKPLYQKTIDCGAMPNNTAKVIDPNVANRDITFINPNGSFWYISSSKVNVPMNYYDVVNNNSTNCTINNDGNIQIRANHDRTGANGIVTIQYTKTTDSTSS